MRELDTVGSQGLYAEGNADVLEALSQKIVEAGRRIREFNASTSHFGLNSDLTRELELRRDCALSIAGYIEAIVSLGVQAWLRPELFHWGVLGAYRISNFDRAFYQIIARTLKEPERAGLLEGVVTYHTVGKTYKNIHPKDEKMVCVQEALMATVGHLGTNLPSICHQGLTGCVNDFGRIEYPPLPF